MTRNSQACGRTGDNLTRDYSGFSGSGTDLEDEVLYGVPWQIGFERTGPLYENEAFSRVRAKQPEGWDPGDPPTIAANDIQVLVAEGLGIDDYSGVKFYTARGSALDIQYGVDAFLEFTDPETGEYQRVTLDLTRDQEKYLDGYKADVIVLGMHTGVAAHDVIDVVRERRAACVVA